MSWLLLNGVHLGHRLAILVCFEDLTSNLVLEMCQKVLWTWSQEFKFQGVTCEEKYFKIRPCHCPA